MQRRCAQLVMEQVCRISGPEASGAITIPMFSRLDVTGRHRISADDLKKAVDQMRNSVTKYARQQ